MKLGSAIRRAIAAWPLACATEGPTHVDSEPSRLETSTSETTAVAEPPPIELGAALDLARLAELNAGCETCHPEAATQWRGSLHRAAFSDDAFATAYRRTPFRFCRDCHAPHGDGRRWPETWAAENGIACVTCHLDPTAHGEAVLAAPGIDDPRTPHAVVRTDALTGAQACARCHEFSFPLTETAAPAGLMQRTVWEHERSGFAHLSCADCHMPEVEVDGRVVRDHGFAMSDDPERLRRSIVVDARRVASDRVALDLVPIAVGHAFPTGDLFRRLELRVELRDARGRTRASAVRYLGRHFAPVPRDRRAPRDVPLEPDDRLVGPATYELQVPEARAGDTLRWQVSWQRVDHRVAEDPERSTLHGEVVLAEGAL